MAPMSPLQLLGMGRGVHDVARLVGDGRAGAPFDEGMPASWARYWKRGKAELMTRSLSS